ncbi:MAG: hypothetical protein H7101_03790 [Deinococcales bacterium]|nr:hypothetical protein [Chitinophagaceae bacterium]
MFTKRNGKTSSELWIGGGTKLPTGKFDADQNAIVASANNQTGTGSYDFLVTAIYSLQIKNWGINSSINYKFNGTKEGYQFGNRLNTGMFIYRSISSKIATFNPNVGLLYEHLNANKLEKTNVDATGGNSLLAAIGTEINFGKIVVGANLQLLVSQNLSDGQTTTKNRGMLHVSYTF